MEQGHTPFYPARNVLLFVLVLVTLIATGCQSTVTGSGDVVEETREVSGFTGVALAGIGELIIELGDEEALRIEAEDNLLEYIETEVKNETLEIRIQRGINLNPTKPVRFYLTVKSLEEIALSGSGDIQAPDLVASQFSVAISGSGYVTMGTLDADALTVDISGSGTLEIAGGQVGKQNITAAGSGEYHAGDLRSETVDIKISGSGDATVWATESLDVRLSGSGSVSYYGHPQTSISSSGSGMIKSLGEK